jgi:hypothetical protein
MPRESDQHHPIVAVEQAVLAQAYGSADRADGLDFRCRNVFG